MNEKLNVLTATMIVIGGGAGVIGLVIVAKFLRWLGMAMWRQTFVFVDEAVVLLISATAEIGNGIKSMMEAVFNIVWSVIFTVLLWMTIPIKTRGGKLRSALREYCKLWQIYWKHGHKEFDNFAAFRRHMLGDEHPEVKAEKEKQQKLTAFQHAQKVMGFSGAEPNTHVELKARYRQMASNVHSDKGFPTDFFLQQINEAVSVIMRARKWK